MSKEIFDIFKATQDYNDILTRLNRYKDNWWNVYNLPIKTYNIAVSEIDNYLTLLNNQITEIDTLIKDADENEYVNEWNLSLTKERVVLLLKQFESLKLQFENAINSVDKDSTKSDISKLNLYNFLDKNDIDEKSKSINILESEIKKYKDIQKELNIKISLDDNSEKELENDINFIDKEILILSTYNKRLNWYSKFKSEVLSLINEKSLKILDLNDIILTWSYIISKEPKNDEIYKEIDIKEQHIDNLKLIIENYNLWINKFHNFLNNLKKLNINWNIIIKKINEILNQKEFDNIKSFSELDKNIVKYIKEQNIDEINNSLSDLYSKYIHINDLINNAKKISDTDLYNIYIKDLDINYLKETKLQDINDINSDIFTEEYKKLNSVIKDLSNKIDELQNHIDLINKYNEYITLYDENYIVSNINKNYRSYNSEIENYFSEIINKLNKLYLNSLSSIDKNIDILNLNTLNKFFNDISKLSNYSDEIDKINSSIDKLYNDINNIKNYNYSTSDSLSTLKNKYNYSNNNLLNSAIIAWFMYSMVENVYEDQKYEYEEELRRQEEERKRKERERQEREEQERRDRERREREEQERRDNSSSSSSWGSSSSSDSSWGSSSSSSSSSSGSYGWSDSF